MMGADEETRISDKSRLFLESIKDEKERARFEKHLENFELACILSDFEDAVLAIPYEVNGHESALRSIHTYIRQVIIAKLGEKVVYNAIARNDKNGADSTIMLIRRLSGDPAGTTSSFGELLKEALTK